MKKAEDAGHHELLRHAAALSTAAILWKWHPAFDYWFCFAAAVEPHGIRRISTIDGCVLDRLVLSKKGNDTTIGYVFKSSAEYEQFLHDDFFVLFSRKDKGGKFFGIDVVYEDEGIVAVHSDFNILLTSRRHPAKPSPLPLEQPDPTLVDGGEENGETS